MKATMQHVGNQLTTWAIENNSEDEVDLFARSAFNRFYYAAFLETRTMLGEFNTSWKKTPHLNIPELLREGVKKKVINTLKALVKSEDISIAESNKIKQSYQISVCELANLLEQAYQIRVLADYEPENKATKDGKVILLGIHKLATAKEWPNQANSYCKAIRKIWKETGLA
ncbi:MAG: hypothetical protein VX185_05975 [Pseudomonadota bacterium]|nr:hypothetical protein [Pseudomonadota bacterium]